MVFERYALQYLAAFNRLDRECWNYEDACVAIGAAALHEATGDAYYLHSVQSYLDRYIAEDGSIAHYDPAEYNIDKIPSGRPLFLLYRQTGAKKYRMAIEGLMNQLRSHPRTESGNLWHKKIYPYQIWLDGLYMGMPFYLEYENAFGDGNLYADVVRQFETAHEALYDAKTGLYYHAFDEKRQQFWADPATGRSPNFWSRSIGWFLMALADCWALMPAEQGAHKAALAGLYKNALDGMLRYQDGESGLFWQLTALAGTPGNYLETSASAMVAYSVFKGVRLGLLEEGAYRPKGEAVLLGLVTRKMEYRDGRLSLGGMCMGAGLGPDNNRRRDGSVAYYLGEPVVRDEQKGAGVVMMALAEYLRLNGEISDHPETAFDVEIFNGEYWSEIPLETKAGKEKR